MNEILKFKNTVFEILKFITGQILKIFVIKTFTPPPIKYESFIFYMLFFSSSFSS